MDREKVIKGLDCCIDESKCGSECPYWDDNGNCRSNMEADAIALLKAQEPRLVTESDFDGADEFGYIPVWTEEKNGDMYCECITKTAITDSDCIGVIRFWTSRPTDEQREAVKWE